MRSALIFKEGTSVGVDFYESMGLAAHGHYDNIIMATSVIEHYIITGNIVDVTTGEERTLYDSVESVGEQPRNEVQ